MKGFFQLSSHSTVCFLYDRQFWWGAGTLSPVDQFSLTQRVSAQIAKFPAWIWIPITWLIRLANAMHADQSYLTLNDIKFDTDANATGRLYMNYMDLYINHVLILKMFFLTAEVVIPLIWTTYWCCRAKWLVDGLIGQLTGNESVAHFSQISSKCAKAGAPESHL